MKFNAPLLLSLLMGLTVHTHAYSATKATKAAKTPASAKGKKTGQRNNVIVQHMRSPPAAKLSLGHDTFLEAGCLNAESIPQLSARLQLQAQDLADEQRSELINQDLSSCRTYSAAFTTPMVRNALALMATGAPAGQMEAVIYSQTAPTSTSVQTPWHLNTDTEVLRQISTSGLRSEGIELQEIPPHLVWEVDLIVRHMLSTLKLEPTSHHLRLTLSPDDSTGLEKIFAIELIESSNAKRIETAIWLERDDVPGAYFSLQGIDYERMLWQSPVQNARISRGVGPSVTTVKRRVAVKSRKKSSPRMAIRTLKVKGHHIGIDFASPLGTPVVAVADGAIIHASFNGGYGNLIIVDHGDGYHTYYAHLSAYALEIKTGTQVRRGEEIGYVGSTGFSTGPHLHFEIRKQGQYIDPAVKENKLQFWTLDVKEQHQILARLLRLQMTPAQQAPVIQSTR